MKSVTLKIKQTVSIGLMLICLCLSGTAFALNTQTDAGLATSWIVANDLDKRGRLLEQNGFESVLQPLAQAAPRNAPSPALRSKSEVMQEVKNRYNAQVVKITLNERTATYSVRVLLPSGKVKNLSVSARK